MPRERPVREIMTSDVVVLQTDLSVVEALGRLVERGISGAPVVDEAGRLVGLLDDSDLLVAEARLHGPTVIELLGAYIPLPGERRRHEEELRHVLGQTVGDLMHRDPPTVPVTGTVEDAATAMIDQRVSRVPIVDEDRRVVGIVTRGDIVSMMARSTS
jgi:CBS domain-containing protein